MLQYKELAERELASLSIVKLCEALLLGEERPYVYKGGLLEWGKDLSQEVLSRMADGEVFLLLDKNNQPYSFILKDTFGTIREKPVSVQT